MEVDTVHVVKRIVALLIDSFQPENVSPSQQVRICVHMYAHSVAMHMYMYISIIIYVIHTHGISLI